MWGELRPPTLCMAQSVRGTHVYTVSQRLTAELPWFRPEGLACGTRGWPGEQCLDKPVPSILWQMVAPQTHTVT